MIGKGESEAGKIPFTILNQRPRRLALLMAAKLSARCRHGRLRVRLNRQRMSIRVAKNLSP